MIPASWSIDSLHRVPPPHHQLINETIQLIKYHQIRHGRRLDSFNCSDSIHPLHGAHLAVLIGHYLFIDLYPVAALASVDPIAPID